jgi:hypothetical protein
MSANQSQLAALDALTERTRETLAGRTVTVPPLLAQLRDAVGNSGERSEGVRRVPSSTPPLDVGALDLWNEIAEAALDWAASCDIDPGPVHAAPDFRPVPARLLRRTAEVLTARGDGRRLQRLALDAERWAARITELLAPPLLRRRRIWGAACPHCATATVTEYDRDGQRVRVPAITLAPDPAHALLWLTCTNCGWKRGVPAPGAAPAEATRPPALAATVA